MDFGKKYRVGNYVILKYNKDGMPRIKCSDNADIWCVEFAIAHKMFGMIDALVDYEANSALINILTTWFAATTILDAEFSKGILELVEGVMSRITEHTEEEDEKSIETVMDMEKMDDIAKDLEKEVS